VLDEHQDVQVLQQHGVYVAVAGEERQALAARLRAGTGERLQTLDQLLAGAGRPVCP
jgi:hypothetical protein